MSAEHGQVQRTHETETTDETQMSSEAAGAAVAIAEQQAWVDEVTGNPELDALLDEADAIIKENELGLSQYKQCI